jgi:XTP/dITP diphosphohydrolase
MTPRPAMKIRVVYCTTSDFKVKENELFQSSAKLDDGRVVGDVFDFVIANHPVKEDLEVELSEMVRAEVTRAYDQIQVPCIVEHAGLVFDPTGARPYPGGLTKAMWNALGDRFVEETGSAGKEVLARAVVAYCDGVEVKTFVGETRGRMADGPKGSRRFYWDTVFVPETSDPSIAEKTYAEIVDDPSFGLEYKVLNLSQSTKAMKAFLEFRLRNAPSLWAAS